MSAHAQNHSPSGSERENERAAEALPDRMRFEIEAKVWAQFDSEFVVSNFGMRLKYLPVAALILSAGVR